MVVKTTVEVDGFSIIGTGIDPDVFIAVTKARAEVIERIASSDLNPDNRLDFAGLFTYRTPTQWCSTGTAAHTDLKYATFAATAELIERDAVAKWLGLCPIGEVVFTLDNVKVYRIPCQYQGWFVCVAERTEVDPENGTERLTQLTGAARKNLAEAAEKAWQESFVRAVLPQAFQATRLPSIIERELPVGQAVLPELTRRVWINQSDLVVVRVAGPDFADFRRGITAKAANEYIEFVGTQVCRVKELQRNWYC
jgi:translation initiation factor IF-1